MAVAILLYHGVIETIVDSVIERNFTLLQTFRDQLSFLQRFPIVGLDDLKTALADESRLSIMITVDDAHRNNLLMAEELALSNLPWVCFVPTGAIDNGMIWTTEIALLLLYGDKKQVRLWDQEWSLVNRKTRIRNYHEIRMRAKKLPAPERRDMMDNLRRQIPESEALLARFPSLHSMTWDEVRELENAGVMIGSHGVEHEIHHSQQPAGVRHIELYDSRQTLEAQLSRTCKCFALPNGEWMADTACELHRSGYQWGFTTQRALASNQSNALLLPRLDYDTLPSML